MVGVHGSAIYNRVRTDGVHTEKGDGTDSGKLELVEVRGQDEKVLKEQR